MLTTSRDFKIMIIYLPGASASIKDIVVTDHAKGFLKSAIRWEPGINGEILANGQGLIGIAWIGKDNNDNDVIYMDLLPAFNKDDNRPRKDKNNVEYKENESVYTDAPLGGNTGRNHMKFLKIIKNRIGKAIEDKDTTTLNMYASMYTYSNGIITINKEKAFGFGVFKGNDFTLLDEVRNKSANLNNSSSFIIQISC